MYFQFGVDKFADAVKIIDQEAAVSKKAPTIYFPYIYYKRVREDVLYNA